MEKWAPHAPKGHLEEAGGIHLNKQKLWMSEAPERISALPSEKGMTQQWVKMQKSREKKHQFIPSWFAIAFGPATHL